MRFELTVTHTGHNGFRDRPVQPLRHLSTRYILPRLCEEDARGAFTARGKANSHAENAENAER